MKAVEINIDDRIAKVELISREGNNLTISIDGRVYKANLLMVERGVYSVLVDNKSYNVELFETSSSREYLVNTFYHSYNVEVVDAETKYLRSRRSDDSHQEAVISSPMPGKVVRIPVREGDMVSAGDTVIIVSAMKMESEYKVKIDRTIKEIRVKEGDTIDSNQPLIIVE